MTQRQYVIEYEYGGTAPKCKCGCGKESTLNKKEWKFEDYYGNHGPDGEKIKEIFDYSTLNPNFQQVDDDFTICKICGESFGNLEALSKHITRKHKDITKEEYVIKYFLDGKRPFCACGCGAPTKFRRIRYGFSRFVHGHHIRGEGNNPGRYDEDTRRLASKTRIEKYESGETKAWNLGLTIENDERVRKNAEKQRQTKANWTKEERLKVADRFRQTRKEQPEKFSHKKESHSQWKGGSSSINSCVRRDERYYQEWVLSVMKRDNFTCQDCGATNHLEVHHDKEELSDLIQRLLRENKIQKATSHQEALVAANVIIHSHVRGEVSGITVCKNCHYNYHPSYNFQAGSRIDPEEQKDRERKTVRERLRRKRGGRTKEEKYAINKKRRKFQ